MPVAIFRTQQHWAKQILAAVIAKCGITDVSDTSILKTLADALGQCLDELGYEASNQRDSFNVATAAGTDLDARALDYLPVGVTRIGAVAAGGALTFGRAWTSAGSAATVPQYTTVSDGQNHFFQTLAAATFPAVTLTGSGAQQTISVNAVALTPGSVGNVAANTLTVFGSKPSGVDTVTNPAAMTGGADSESDDAFRTRIYAYTSGLSRSTADAITTALLGVSDTSGNTILSVTVLTGAATPGACTIYIDNGSGTINPTSTAVTGENLCASLLGPPVGSAAGLEMWLNTQHYPINMDAAFTLTASLNGTLTPLTFDSDYYLDQTTGSIQLVSALTQGEKVIAAYSYFSGLLATAQKIVTGDPNDRANYPGVAAAGIQAIVAVPDAVFPIINLDLVVDSSHDRSTVTAAVATAVATTVNSLANGATLYLASIISTAMAVDGVIDVAVNSPTSDVVVTPAEVIRTTSVTVS